MNVSTLVRRVLVGGGVVAFGIAVMSIAGVGPALPAGGTAIALIGVVSMLMGLLSARSRLQSEQTETVTPDPELPPHTPPPGDEVDQQLYEMIELQHGMQENRDRIEERLEAAAIRIIRQRDDCSRVQAQVKLQEGNWTDNDVARDFFSDSSSGDGGGSIENLLGSSNESAEFKEQVEDVIDELARLGNMEFEGADKSAADSGGLLGRLRGGGDDDDDGPETQWNAETSSIDTFDVDEPFVDLDTHETNRWLGVTTFALLAVGLGVFVAQPGLVLAGSVAVGYTAYARATATPPTEHVEVEREFSDDAPNPGDEVQVTVTVRNTGPSILPDLRLIDIVPDPFIVTRGSPRLHTTLASGEADTFSYTVEVERGNHTWPLLCLARDFSGSVERESLVTPEDNLVCKPVLSARTGMPVRAQTTQYAGDVETSVGGSGLEFHSVREYRAGDPMNRINWKRYARTGEFATVDFRQEKAAKITLLFDTRERAYSAESPGKPHAVDLSVHAATDVFSSLYDAGNLVGVAAFDTVPCWLAPGAGSAHLERARELFAEHPALSAIPPSKANIEGTYIDPMTHVRRQLPSNSQVFLFTPLADDYASETARRLDSAGHLVTIVSPDTTSDKTVGQRLAHIERELRLAELRERGIRAIDWDPEDRLTLEIERAQTRWA